MSLTTQNEMLPELRHAGAKCDDMVTFIKNAIDAYDACDLADPVFGLMETTRDLAVYISQGLSGEATDQNRIDRLRCKSSISEMQPVTSEPLKL